MKITLLFLTIILSLQVNSQNSGVKHVVSHRNVTVTTHPSGLRKFLSWAVFPGKQSQIRKILMHVTLGCPDTLPCAHWDYLDHITLLKSGGRNGRNLNYELGRMLTPYGSIYNKGWSFTWTADVTDFALELRDSVQIEYAHSGYEPQTVGWSLTIDFEVYQGRPVINPLSITPLWFGSFPYGDPKKELKKLLVPIPFVMQKNSSINRIRIQQTGHGMDNPKGCSEFCSRWRDIKMDGIVINHQNLWKECGSNPLYPQGGTWIFDRGWWCPGDLQTADSYDVFSKPGEHSVEIEMEPYTAKENIQAAENIASYLIQYSAPTCKNDASLEEILVPNKKQNYNRMNPACFHPIIIIRNLGSNPLQHLDVNYQTIGSKIRTFHWKGNLKFNQKEEVILPGDIESMPGEVNNFMVRLTNPNGQIDEWTADNLMVSQFDPPTVLPEKFVVQYLSNNHPKDNSIYIINGKGDTTYLKSPDKVMPHKEYRDTLYLKAGKYEMTLTDSAGNGLEFWYEAKQGYGYLRLLDLKGRLLHNFESDCGNGQFFAFMTTPAFVPDTCNSQFAFVLYPRRTSDSISLDYHADVKCHMEVRITMDGQLVEKHEYQSVKQGKFFYNVGYLPKGRYILEAIMNGESRFKRRFNIE
ncbi:MAG: peptide-N-glycosidase F-related protein [Prolixibacteraceae bacterium]